MRRSIFAVVALAGALWGCDARYDSLARDATGTDAGPGQPDGGVADGGSLGDQGGEVVLATGALVGRSGYSATGAVDLVRLTDGGLELRFSSDFSAAGVPSPVALLTTRDTVAGGIQAALGDLSLGPMASVVGAQAYVAPEAGSGALYAFVYCLPFTVEVARAVLVPAS